MNGDSVALDTNEAIAVLNASEKATDWLQPYREACLPVPVIGELRFGALNSRRQAENLERVEKLLTRCRVLDVTSETTRVYATVRLGLKEKGKPIPENDVWIAAVCMEHDLSLVSSDEHFEAVDGLKLIKPADEEPGRPNAV